MISSDNRKSKGPSPKTKSGGTDFPSPGFLPIVVQLCGKGLGLLQICQHGTARVKITKSNNSSSVR